MLVSKRVISLSLLCAFFVGALHASEPVRNDSMAVAAAAAAPSSNAVQLPQQPVQPQLQAPQLPQPEQMQAQNPQPNQSQVPQSNQAEPEEDCCTSAANALFENLSCKQYGNMVRLFSQLEQQLKLVRELERLIAQSEMQDCNDLKELIIKILWIPKLKCDKSIKEIVLPQDIQAFITEYKTVDAIASYVCGLIDQFKIGLSPKYGDIAAFLAAGGDKKNGFRFELDNTLKDLLNKINQVYDAVTRLLIEMEPNSVRINFPVNNAVQILPAGNNTSNASVKTSGSTSSQEKSDAASRLVASLDATQAIPAAADNNAVAIQNATRPLAASTLHEAAVQNDRARIRQLMNQGHNVNQLHNGFSPLHIAVKAQNYDAIITLLDGNEDFGHADFDQYSTEGLTPLHYAILTKYDLISLQSKIVNELITRKAYINVPVCGNYWFKTWRSLDTLNGSTPLRLACLVGNHEIAKLLIEKGADINRSGIESPLVSAAKGGHSEIVKLLLEHNANILSGEKPLLDAASCGHCNVVKVFLDHNYQERVSLIYSLYNPFKTGLQESLEKVVALYNPDDPERAKKYLEIAELLLEREAYCSAQMLADAFCNDKKIAMTQLLAKYPIDVNKALRLVANNRGNDRCIRLLLAKRADIGCLPQEFRNHYCLKYPLHEAAEAGDVVRIKAILAKNRNMLNQEDEGSSFPLHYAASKDNVSVIDALCDGRMPITDCGNALGLLPLHCAATMGHTDVLKALLKYDQQKNATCAIINAQNIFGLTPLHAAIMNGKIDAMCLLMKAGADCSVTSSRGLTPIDYVPMNKVLCDYFSPAGTIASIVQLHCLPSSREDKQGELLNIGASCPALIVKGEIIPSLQQVRFNEKITSYCGYYALYNALSFLNFDGTRGPANVRENITEGNFDIGDRQKFGSFFKWTLQLVAAERKIGGLGFLLKKELQTILVKTCPNEPIVVVEKNELKTIADQITTPDQLFAESKEAIAGQGQELIDNEQMRELALLRSFSKGELKKIVLIMGVGYASGHWLAMLAERTGKKISIKVADSLRLVADWKCDKSLVVNNILPFYLMLKRGIDSCPQIFDQVMQSELFEEYQPKELAVCSDGDKIRAVSSNQLAFLTVALQSQIESTRRLKEVIELLLDAISSGSFDLCKKLLANLRLERFKRSSIVLLDCSLRGRLHLSGNNSYQQILSNLEKLFFKDDEKDLDIFKSLESIISIEDFNAMPKDLIFKELHKVIDKLCAMDTLICELERLARDQTSTSARNFFNANAILLDDELLAFVLRSLPEQLQGIIGEIRKNEPSAPRLLFYGPPGNGKTTMPQAIAQLSGRPFFMIRIASVGNKYQFSQEEQLESINKCLEQHPNALILLDEIDCVFTEKKENDKAAKSLGDIIKDAAIRYPRAVFCATTNCDVQYVVDNSITRDESGQKEFPAPLKSLFGQNVYKIDKPTYDQRSLIIDYYCKRYGKTNIIKLSEADKRWLVKNTDSYSIRDIESMFAQARQSLMAPDGAQLIANELARLQGKPTLAKAAAATAISERIINIDVMKNARNVVYQSILTHVSWKKRVADGYYIAEKFAHLLNLGVSITNPLIQHVWRSQDIENQKTLHNASHPISQQVEYVDGKFQHVDNDLNGSGLLASICRNCPIIGTKPENYTYVWKNGVYSRGEKIPKRYLFTKTDVNAPYPTVSNSGGNH